MFKQKLEFQVVPEQCGYGGECVVSKGSVSSVSRNTQSEWTDYLGSSGGVLQGTPIPNWNCKCYNWLRLPRSIIIIGLVYTSHHRDFHLIRR